MHNVVIFSGGTGSIAIQEGFSALYGHKSLNLDIIINAYDNGLSTGSCRKVMGDSILGPSDLRKNQMTQFRLQKEKQLKDWWSRESMLYRLFQLRFDAVSKEDYYEHSARVLDELKGRLSQEDLSYLRGLLDEFFFTDPRRGVWRQSLEGVEFNDFSLANVFYSADAAHNGNSLRIAGTNMANFLGIEDNVHLISDVNLYLQARTESGRVIEDEGEIVAWDNADDRISSIMLLKNGEEYVPEIDEELDLSLTRSCKEIVSEADIIIFSSGTQWSSLIPTYVHRGFKEMIESSRARKYLVINTSEDHDMKGVTADEIVRILEEFLPLSDVTAVVNVDAPEGLCSVDRIASIVGHIGAGPRKHNPVGLVRLIMTDYMKLQGFEGTFVFDLDGTLWDETEDGPGKSIGAQNVNLFRGIVHSGNNYEHVRDVFKYLYWKNELVHIYSDFGNVHFTSNDSSIHLLSNEYAVSPEVIEALEEIEQFRGKVRSRGEGCVVTIKPLKNRKKLLEKARIALKRFGGKYEAKIAGHTSIDVTCVGYGKKEMLKHILASNDLCAKDVIFVGNETTLGAEQDVSDTGVRVIQVNDVYECNVLLRTIMG